MHPQLLAAIFTQVWAIAPEIAIAQWPTIAQLLEGKNPNEGMDTAEMRKQLATYAVRAGDHGDDEEEENRLEDIGDAPAGSIAILSIQGIMMKYSMMCGPAGTEALVNDINMINNMGNISAMVLKIDSGGGTVAGLANLSDAIKASKKPIVAFVDGMAASAAYWAASSAQEIMMSQNIDRVGSIGTMISFADVRPALEKDGVKFHEIYATKSTLKNQDFLQALEGKYDKITKDLLDPHNEAFHTHVQESRPNLSNDKRILQGEMFYAEEAIQLGLADSVGSITDAVARAAALANVTATTGVESDEEHDQGTEQAPIKSTIKNTIQMKKQWNILMATLGWAAFVIGDADASLTEGQMGELHGKIEGLEKARTDAAAAQVTAETTLANYKSGMDKAVVSLKDNGIEMEEGESMSEAIVRLGAATPEAHATPTSDTDNVDDEGTIDGKTAHNVEADRMTGIHKTPKEKKKEEDK